MLGLGLGLNRNTGALNRPLLQQIPNAVAGYSLNRLTSTATSTIRVYRDSDMAEMDIGLIVNKLDTASLLAFAGSGSAFVVSWTDQTNNGNNAIQSVAENCPRIVNNGVLEVDSNGDVSMFFDGANDFLRNTTLGIITQPNTIVAKFETIVSLSNAFVVDGTSNNRQVIYNNNGQHAVFAGTKLDYEAISLNETKVFTAVFNGSNTDVYKDGGGKITGNAGTLSLENLSIGVSKDDLSHFSGYISDIIIFNRALTQAEATKLNRL